eukprot:2348249-Pyramimonas_sp.AAC.1
MVVAPAARRPPVTEGGVAEKEVAAFGRVSVDSAGYAKCPAGVGRMPTRRGAAVLAALPIDVSPALWRLHVKYSKRRELIPNANALTQR